MSAIGISPPDLLVCCLQAAPSQEVRTSSDNYVPLLPLQDGGRILVDALLTCGLAESTTALITCGVATPIAIGIIVWGCVQFQVITILVRASLHNTADSA